MYGIPSCIALIALARAAASVSLCGQSVYTSPSGYTFNANAWADDGSGSQCIDVNQDGTNFTATWSWTKNPTSVHSYPYIALDTNLLPIRLSDVESLNMRVPWKMRPEGSNIDVDETGLSAISTLANVALDLFADADSNNAKSPTQANYEIMVWVGSFGDPKPLGWNASTKVTQQLGDNVFTLYIGSNSRGQQVYSWLSDSNLPNFDEDILPLLEYLSHNGLVPNSTYLGVIQFGTEAFHATSKVEFSVSNFNMTLASDVTPKSPIPSGKPQQKSGATPALLLNPFGLLIVIILSCGSYMVMGL